MRVGRRMKRRNEKWRGGWQIRQETSGERVLLHKGKRRGAMR